MPSFIRREGRAIKYDPGEINKYVRTLEDRQDTSVRYRIHERDESLWRLDRYVLEEISGKSINKADWPSFTGNDPRTYWNAIRRAVTSNAPTMRIQLPSLRNADDVEDYEAEEEERNRQEKFLIGLWRSVEEHFAVTVRLGFQDNLGWQACIRGGMAARLWVDTDEKDYPFRAALWDLRTVAWEPGANGLEFVTHHYWAPYYEIKGRYPDCDAKPDEHGMVECYDAWWLEHETGRRRGRPTVWNAFNVGSYAAIEATEYRELTRIPVVILPTFTPDIEVPYTKGKVINSEWESIYTANAEVYAWMNRIYTLYGLYLRNSAIGPYVSDIPGAPADQIVNALKPFGVITTARPGTGISPVSPPVMATEAKEFASFLQGQAQRGAVPYSVYGQIPFELSGFAVNQLQGAVSIVAGQVAKQMATFYRLCSEEFLRQFKSAKGRVTVMGADKRRQRFIDEYKSSEIPDKYYLEVELSPELPVDKLQEAQIASQWAQLGISPLTIIDEVLKLQDPKSEVYRMAMWMKFKMQAEQEVQQAQAAPPGAAPNVLPLELQGITDQHNSFQPTFRNLANSEIRGRSNGIY